MNIFFVDLFEADCEKLHGWTSFHALVGMQYRRLGGDGPRVSRIGFGGWQIGSPEWGSGRIGGKHGVELLREAADSGINFIDTAESYGAGESEATIGTFLRERREDVVLATKVSPLHLHPDRLLRACRASLRRLRTCYIDVYQIHSPNILVPPAETAHGLKQLLDDKVVLHVGVSNFSAQQVLEIQEALEPHRLVSVQTFHNVLFPGTNRALGQALRTVGASFVACSPLCHGALANRSTSSGRQHPLAETDFRRNHPLFSRQASAHLVPLRGELARLAEAKGVTVSVVALAWSLRQNVACSIAGMSTFKQIRENAVAVDLRLTQAEATRLERVAAKARRLLQEAGLDVAKP